MTTTNLQDSKALEQAGSFTEVGYTTRQADAIHQTLITAHLKPDADWPRILSDITVLVSDAHEGAAAPGAVAYAATEKRTLKALSKILNDAAQAYDHLGELLQWHVDDQCRIQGITSSGHEWAALVLKQTGGHSCPIPSTRRYGFRELLQGASSAVRLATEHPNTHALVQTTGAPKNHAMHLIVTDLLAIFEQATGIAPKVYTSQTTDSGYAGNFYPFAVACLVPLRLVPRTQLGSSIISVYTQGHK